MKVNRTCRVIAAWLILEVGPDHHIVARTALIPAVEDKQLSPCENLFIGSHRRRRTRWLSDRRRCECFAHTRQAALKSCPVVWRLDATFGQLGEPLHLVTERPPLVPAGRQTGDGLNRTKHP